MISGILVVHISPKRKINAVHIAKRTGQTKFQQLENLVWPFFQTVRVRAVLVTPCIPPRPLIFSYKSPSPSQSQFLFLHSISSRCRCRTCSKLAHTQFRRMRVRSCLEVWKMGTVNYAEALKLQAKLVQDRKAQKIPDTLLSLQHPPTYTLGKRKTDHNILIPESELKNIGAELHYTERGGDVTFHGPGQAVLYPIISLRDVGVGARRYVEKLELTMIEMASLYGVKASPGRKCETGVWVGDRKIGAIGVRIQSGITSHGLAFNVDPDLGYFKHIVPCGIADKDVTSLSRETNLELPSDDVIHEQLISCFATQFEYTMKLLDKRNVH